MLNINQNNNQNSLSLSLYFYLSLSSLSLLNTHIHTHTLRSVSLTLSLPLCVCLSHSLLYIFPIYSFMYFFVLNGKKYKNQTKYQQKRLRILIFSSPFQNTKYTKNTLPLPKEQEYIPYKQKPYTTPTTFSPLFIFKNLHRLEVFPDIFPTAPKISPIQY